MNILTRLLPAVATAAYLGLLAVANAATPYEPRADERTASSTPTATQESTRPLLMAPDCTSVKCGKQAPLQMAPNCTTCGLREKPIEPFLVAPRGCGSACQNGDKPERFLVAPRGCGTSCTNGDKAEPFLVAPRGCGGCQHGDKPEPFLVGAA